MHKKIFSFVVVCAVSSLMFAGDCSRDGNESSSVGTKVELPRNGKQEVFPVTDGMKAGALCLFLTGNDEQKGTGLNNIIFDSKHPMGCSQECWSKNCKNQACKLGFEVGVKRARIVIEKGEIHVETIIDNKRVSGNVYTHQNSCLPSQVFTDNIKTILPLIPFCLRGNGLYINGEVEDEDTKEKTPVSLFVPNHELGAFIKEAKSKGLMDKNYIDTLRKNWTYHHAIHLAFASLIAYLLLRR